MLPRGAPTHAARPPTPTHVNTADPPGAGQKTQPDLQPSFKIRPHNACLAHPQQGVEDHAPLPGPPPGEHPSAWSPVSTLRPRAHWRRRFCADHTLRAHSEGGHRVAPPLRALPALIHFSLIMDEVKYYHYSHNTDKNTEAQRG